MDFEGGTVIVNIPALTPPGAELCTSITLFDDNILEEDVEFFTVISMAMVFPNGGRATVNIGDNDG